MNYTWQLKDIPNPTDIQTLQNQLQIPPSLATILVQRKINTFDKARFYFRPDLSQLHDPFLMKDMDKAVSRFQQAMAQGEKILIYGDYDVDGTTAVSLFLNSVKKYYTNIDFYIPDRFSEGYGVNSTAVEQIASKGFTLMFTLDCGTKSVNEIALARQLGIDVIVCDHHEPGENLPEAFILNPKQNNCFYPYKDLSGAGVAFKFLQAVFMKNNWNSQELIKNIDLLTLSIAADIVPITGENRIFCWYGIEQINRKESVVIDLMLQSAKRNYPIQLSDIVFSIAPRINAAGRMQHAKQIVELFISDDLFVIKEHIQEINTFNEERRALDKLITSEAVQEMISNSTQQFSNVVYKEDWSKGVIGIVASKLVEKNNRPSIVFTKSNGVLTGSGRSIPSVNLYAILCKCEAHLTQFGGHYFACGLSLKEENLPAFKKQFDQEIGFAMNGNVASPILEIDLEIDFENIYTSMDVNPTRLPKFVRILNEMEPFGPENMRPVFVTKNVYISTYKILKEAHIKFDFQQKGTPIRIEGIAFNFIEKFSTLENTKLVDIVYAIGINHWNDQERVQLEIRDIRNSANP